MTDKRTMRILLCFLLLSGLPCSCLAAIGSGQDTPETAKVYGPYHGLFIQGGLGLKKPFSPWMRRLRPPRTGRFIAGRGVMDRFPRIPCSRDLAI
jgi:hypothetical protein